MLIYFILILYIIVLYFLLFYNYKNKNNRNKLFLILAFIPLTLVMGFRAKSVGVDTNNYCNLFEYYSNLSLKQLIITGGGDGSTDYLYLIYNKLIAFFGGTANTLIFCNSLIVCLLAANFIYKQCNNHIFLSVMLFIGFCHYMYYFNANRQGIAILIMANAIGYLFDGNLKKYIAMIIIASLVHTTALVYLIFVPLFFIKLDKKNIYFYLIVVTIIFISWQFFLQIISKFSAHYGLYIEDEVLVKKGGNRKLIYTLIYMAFEVLLLILFNRVDKNNLMKTKEYKILIILNYILILSGILYIKNWIFVRIEDYFAIYDILFIPFVTTKIKNKILINTIIIFIIFIGMYIRLSSGYAGVVPYSTWF